MKLLVIGGAGYVGSILRPALEKHHHCIHFDLRRVPEAGERSIAGDVNDDEAVQKVFAEFLPDAVMYLAMGAGPGDSRFTCNQIDPAFHVNVRGTYRVLHHAMAAGVRRFVYASTLSVYQHLRKMGVVTEDTPVDAWHPYGLSKRLAEYTLGAATQKWPDRTFLALRLMLPRNEKDWPKFAPGAPLEKECAIGPNDTRRLFLAAAGFDRPGLHILQASGDIPGTQFPNTRAIELLGWRPAGD